MFYLWSLMEVIIDVSSVSKPMSTNGREEIGNYSIHLVISLILPTAFESSAPNTSLMLGI